ncbi:pentapeptide repeat-containing protein [Bradyrhizobium brasilense]|uniref:Pentapeptide repeat-containing protein n=1 Tax=Bradyrhizobium brasilense TaxID=1419277 RepID=A0ABY8JB08_9BRAD|nr:pentapeptide repeat-containing protein [Bradyrhizobium brasilense]WFU62676.1 pentapeptide repeat-containing protein [Bradyrhizobium brasilense]
MSAIVWCVSLFATFGLAAIILVPKVVIPDSRSGSYDEIVRIATARNSIRSTIAQTVAGLAFVVTFIQTSVNFNADYRLKSELATADQFGKAFSQLKDSSDNTWVTVGSFYVLVRVAESDPKYRDPVYAAMAQYVVNRSRRDCGVVAGGDAGKGKNSYREPGYSPDEAVRAATRLIFERAGIGDRGRRQLDLEGACLSNADAWGTNGLSQIYMPGGKLLRASAAATTITDSDLRGVEAGVVHNANWSQFSSLGTWALHHDVPPEKLARLQANFENARFDNVSLQGAGLEGANLQGASFVTSRLTGTNFELADLRGASFGASDVNGAGFYGANIARADLSKVENLTAQQILAACIRDEPTIKGSIKPKLPSMVADEVEKVGGIRPCA